jgi:hypothetical protein
MDLIDVFIDEKIPFESINRDMVRVTAKGIDTCGFYFTLKDA